MKGIILAGGAGSRLNPITLGISKQLIPIYDKPMIYYPLSTLVQSGINEILVISTPHDMPSYKRLLGDGSAFGLTLKYKIQEQPNGLAQAFILGNEFIGNSDVTLILGDNVFLNNDKYEVFSKAIASVKEERISYIFGYKVKDPQRYGVAEINKNDVISLEEKPKNPKSDIAVVGMYCYTNDVVNKVKNLKPSKRGELEITDLNKLYLKDKKLKIKIIKNNLYWMDTGTQNSLYESSTVVKNLEERNDMKYGCIEEVALAKKFMTKDMLKSRILSLGKNEYALYLERLLEK